MCLSKYLPNVEERVLFPKLPQHKFTIITEMISLKDYPFRLECRWKIREANLVLFWCVEQSLLLRNY